MKINTLVVFLFCVSNIFVFAQTPILGVEKSYLDCEGNVIYKTITETTPIDSVGRSSKGVTHRYETVMTIKEIPPYKDAWVKKVDFANCCSPYEEYCLAWCLVAMPARFDTLVEKIDLGWFKNNQPFGNNQAAISAAKSPCGDKAMQEVFCGTKRSIDDEELIGRIQSALRINGYKIDDKEKGFGRETQAAFFAFQKKHQLTERRLTVGRFDKQTVNALRVDLN